jgi:hypothetical protein
MCCKGPLDKRPAAGYGAILDAALGSNHAGLVFHGSRTMGLLLAEMPYNIEVAELAGVGVSDIDIVLCPWAAGWFRSAREIKREIPAVM